MRRLRHAYRLGRDVVTFADAVGTLWLLPVIVIILVAAIAAGAAHVAVPYVVYTVL